MEENRAGVQGEGPDLALIIDSSILFSIIVAGRRARAYKIIAEYPDIELYSPEEVLVEFHTHMRKLEKSAREEFWNKVLLAFSLVRIVPREVYEDRLREAYLIASNFDPKDTPLIALSLKLEIPIWTEDKALLRHSFISRRYVALDTDSIERLSKGEPLNKILEKLQKKLL